MNDSLRKGWCPGALRPMAAKDGLLVRLRISGGILPAASAVALADLAVRYGNGFFDITGRGKLQIRGVRAASLPVLQDGLTALGLLDRDADAESVRNVIASPLAGLHDGLDIRPVVAALEARLAADAPLHALPGKFGFLVDDGGAPSLADVYADVRFDWLAAEGRFAIGLGGTLGTAAPVGWCMAAEVVACAVSVARGVLLLLAACPGARRMRDLVAAFGVGAVSRACAIVPSRGRAGAGVSHPGPHPERTIEARDVVGHRTFAGVPALGLAAPFGRLDAAMLRAAAAVAKATPSRELRLTPWRIFLVPRASGVLDAPTGFITDPMDSRLSIAACVGADGCERGTTSTRADATHLAAHLSEIGAAFGLHVSGCAKGCAKASSSPATLVARDGRYDLVYDGCADDPPARRDLDLEAVCLALDAMMVPA